MVKAVAFGTPNFWTRAELLAYITQDGGIWAASASRSAAYLSVTVRTHYGTLCPVLDVDSIQMYRLLLPFCLGLSLGQELTYKIRVLASRLSRAVIAVPPAHRARGFRHTRKLQFRDNVYAAWMLHDTARSH